MKTPFTKEDLLIAVMNAHSAFVALAADDNGDDARHIREQSRRELARIVSTSKQYNGYLNKGSK